MLEDKGKRATWKEDYGRLLNVEFPLKPEDLSEETSVEGPSKPITDHLRNNHITMAISKIDCDQAA